MSDDGKFQRVAAENELAQGKVLSVKLADHEVLLARTAEGVFAVDNLCSHAAERLCHGKLKGHRIICPLHGAAFDVRDGQALTRPATKPLRSFPVRLEAGHILVADTRDELNLEG